LLLEEVVRSLSLLESKHDQKEDCRTAG
jgi:hypothetical protein